MSCRLHVELLKNGEHIASGCSRYGAYTACAAETVDEVIDELTNSNRPFNRTWDSSGRITSQCIDPVSRVVNKLLNTNLIDGTMTKEEVKEVGWFDGEVKIDVAKKTVHFDSLLHYTPNEMEEVFGPCDGVAVDVIPDEISFRDWPKWSDKFKIEQPEYYVTSEYQFVSVLE